MPFDGSGGYSAPVNSWNPAVSQTVIDPQDWNSTQSDYETAFSTCLTKDGQTTPTNNLPMGGFKHTGVNTNSGSTSRSEYASGATLQDGAPLDAGDTAGTSTAYTATLTPAITAYADKQCFRVKFDQACGLNPTINFNAVGAKKIYANISGTATQLASGDVPANYIGILRYDTALDSAAGGFWLLNGPASNIGWDQLSDTIFDETPAAPAMLDKVPFGDASDSDNKKVGTLDSMLGLLAGHLWGCQLSNNGTDANNDVDISAGVAVDNTNFVAMRLASSLTKQLDAAWAVGTNQGGLDTGSKANSTWYHVYIIQRSDTGVVDALFSTSATSPTMPTNYDRKRRVGAVLTDGSGNIRGFIQRGDYFFWLTPIQNINTNTSTSAALVTVSTPLGVSTIAMIFAVLDAGAGDGIYFSSPDVTDNSTTTTNSIGSIYSGAGYGGAVTHVATNTSSQIRWRSEVASRPANASTLGYLDYRGKDS